MRRFVLGLSFGLLLMTPALSSPVTRADNIFDQMFGVTIADPYRWLEADVRQDSQVKDWVDQQNQFTQAYLSSLPGRAALATRLGALMDYDRYGAPVAAGKYLFFTRSSGLQNQSPLYVIDALGEAPRLLIDPNGWAGDHATALASYHPSHDGGLVAYQIQDGGTDWRQVRVMETKTGKILPDHLDWVKFSSWNIPRLSWAKDNSGFFYTRFPQPDQAQEFQTQALNQAIYFHKLGTDQSADRLIYATPDQPDQGHDFDLTDDGATLVIYSHHGEHQAQLRLLDIHKAHAKAVVLKDKAASAFTLIGKTHGKLYFTTDMDVPRGQIVVYDPIAGTFKTVIAQNGATLLQARLHNGLIVVEYLEDVKADLRLFKMDGTALGSASLPGIGSITGLTSAPGGDLYYTFSSFNTPTGIYRLDVKTKKSAPFLVPKAPIDPAGIAVTQVFYPSKDGTKIPMFIIAKAGLDLATPRPTLLYGYGGFNISLTPGYSPTRLGWIEKGGVLAIANLRGGGEYGSTWHDAGRGSKKQNVFDDFIAAAEYLIARGTTTKAQLAIQGGSNGGLLVGAVVNQRPDLFAAALPAVGVMDMLRFHLFTEGASWMADYGDPREEQGFKTLIAYSPYHTIKSGVDYPAILATTADTDDRVVPGHTFKYVAALQAAAIGPKPHLVRIETRAGHGAGKPTDKIIAEYADMWAFIAYHTGLDLTQ
jgi:prolyl oligopeptidase